VLCEGEENLLLMPGTNNAGRLRQLLGIADSAVILKAYRNMPAIRGALAESGRGSSCVFASRLGFAGEKYGYGLAELPQSPSYLSLLIIPPER
jgi:precorrin-2/cobalt-factor-2 C20-methyltransferase